MSALKRELATERLERSSSHMSWTHPATGEVLPVMDSPFSEALDSYAQTIAGRPWIISGGAAVGFCGGPLTWEEWTAEMQAEQHPEDMYTLGGLVELKNHSGKLINAFTLLSESFYGQSENT